MNEIELINKLLADYQAANHTGMAECFHEEATFQDIAFRLRGRKNIHAMYHMICNNGITVTIDQSAIHQGETVVARITDKYIFSDTQRPVKNPIKCTFRFRDGLIVEQRDECDAADWGRQAIGGIKGWAAGHIPFLRHLKAKKKLKLFIKEHHQYA